MQIPDKIPELGFYRHYKHDPNGAINNYVYELVNIGFHTEDDCRPEDRHMANYRPLYPWAPVYLAGKFFDNRPLGMFLGTVEKDSQTIPRFQKITDPETIRKLKLIRDMMYPSTT